MKIKTITCHDVYNYGATLQAYALMKYLQNLGHEVEIIDYKPDFMDKRYKLWPAWKRSCNICSKALFLLIDIAKLPIRLLNRARKYSFDKFTKTHLCITKIRYLSNAELRHNPPPADLYIAGSDQIWNTMYPNGKDPAFYLDFAPSNSIKASYAASFATESITEGYEEFVKKRLSFLDYISVREQTGIEILNTLGISRGYHVLDPVFLIDTEEWTSMVEKPIIPPPYILVYDFENNPMIQQAALKMKKKTGFKMISINDWFKNPYVDTNIKDAGPKEFLTLIYYSDLFFSNSFHGLAFSVIFQKEFYTFNRINQKVNSRMLDFLKIIGISNRLVDSIEVVPLNEIDYDSVKKKLFPKIYNSKRYLNTVMSACKLTFT